MPTTNKVKPDQYRQIGKNTFIRILNPEYTPTADNKRKLLLEAPLDDLNLAALCKSFLVDQGAISSDTPTVIILKYVENPEINCTKDVHFVSHSAYLEKCLNDEEQDLKRLMSCFHLEPYQFSAIEFKNIPKIDGAPDEDYLAKWIETVTNSYSPSLIYLPYTKDENINYVLMREEEFQLICFNKDYIFHPRF